MYGRNEFTLYVEEEEVRWVSCRLQDQTLHDFAPSVNHKDLQSSQLSLSELSSTCKFFRYNPDKRNFESL